MLIVIIIVFVVVFLVLPIIYLAFRMRNEEFVAGGSFGKQISGSGKDEQEKS
ncbi:MAG TPA: hypothetical protein VF232_12675 [Gaiellaceae bacterium]